MEPTGQKEERQNHLEKNLEQEMKKEGLSWQQLEQMVQDKRGSKTYVPIWEF